MGHGSVRVLLREAQVRQHKHGLLPRSHHGRATEVATEVLLPHVARGLVAEGPRIRTFVLLYPDYRLAPNQAKNINGHWEKSPGKKNEGIANMKVTRSRIQPIMKIAHTVKGVVVVVVRGAVCVLLSNGLKRAAAHFSAHASRSPRLKWSLASRIIASHPMG